MLNSKNQLRTIGVNSKQFNHILIALQKEIYKDLEIHSMKRIGVKTKKGNNNRNTIIINSDLSKTLSNFLKSRKYV